MTVKWKSLPWRGLSTFFLRIFLTQKSKIKSSRKTWKVNDPRHGGDFVSCITYIPLFNSVEERRRNNSLLIVNGLVSMKLSKTAKNVFSAFNDIKAWLLRAFSTQNKRKEERLLTPPTIIVPETSKTPRKGKVSW